MIFKRKIYNKILEWKTTSSGSTALLIEGARRIGKSTIVREFAKNEYDSYIIIDFSDVSPEILQLFDNISDRNGFFLALQVFTGVQLIERKSLIVFDEIQLCPKARQAIKHLVADGRYDYIETGSLLSIRKNVKNILIPSEEERIAMYPLDFEEFLWAVGKPMYYDAIRDAYRTLRALGDAMNRMLMREFRRYMLVGGMPQAVDMYLQSNDFAKVDAVKRRIINLYQEDFRKIDESGRVSEIFKSIPSQLSRNRSRYRIGSTIKNARPSRSRGIFVELDESKTVNFAYHSNDPGLGLSLHADTDFFKLFLGDTGLFVTLAFMDKVFTDNEIYRKLLLDKLPADLGYVYENVVAQMLRSAGHSLFYYTFQKESDEGKKRNYEIDFLITRRDKICPVEVKSSNYRVHKSIDEFSRKFSLRISERYLLYTKDIRREGELICLPVYMAGLL